jgi:hypothetical protein
MAALWILIGAGLPELAPAQAPYPKTAEPDQPPRPKRPEHPLDKPPAKTWRTHREAGHQRLLDPANWEIRGCQTFSADDIRGTVTRDEDVLLAMHPAAPADELEKLPALLVEKIVDGYLTDGFPRTTVKASLAGDHIRIDIVEGPRYKAGTIEILGTDVLDVKRLLVRLTEPYIPESATAGAFEVGSDGKTEITWLSHGNSIQRPKLPPWEIGKPAWLAAEGTKFLRRQMEHACANQGRPDAKFDLEIKIEPDSDAARLRIRVTDEGPALVIKQVTIKGCQQNTQQQVIDYLQVKPGAVWTREEELRVKQRLWQAGRFRRSSVKIDRQPGSSEATLLVNVTESEAAPPLSQAFTPIEQALLKFRDWIGALPHSDCDLVLTGTVNDARVEAIMSPKLGGMLSYQPADVDDEPAPAHRVVVSTDALGLYSQASGRRLVARPLPGYLLMTCEFDLTKEDKGERGRFFIGMGAKSWSSAPPGPPALRSLFLAPPVAFVHMAHKYQECSILADGVLTLSIPDEDEHSTTILRVDAATGKLLELVYRDSDCAGCVTVKKNAFRDRAAALEAEFGKKPNEFDPSQPLGSTLAFVAREIDTTALFSASDETTRTLAKVARKALAGRLLEPLDQSLVRLDWLTRVSNLRFCLGTPAKKLRDWNGSNPEAFYSTWLYTDRWAAPNSWLGDLTREAICTGVGLKEYTPMEIAHQLIEPRNGPLANLAAAAALDEAGARKAAFLFARRGRQSLEAAKFRADVVALLDDRGLAGRCLLRAGEVLRNFDEQDVVLLALQLPPAEAMLLADFWRELHKAPKQPIAEAIPDALNRLWDSQIKPRLAAGLNDYHDPSPQATIPEPTLWKPSAPQLLDNSNPSDAKPVMKPEGARR